MLFDHFSERVDDHRPWTSVHSQLATELSAHLNANLPTGYFACPEVRRRHEVDVAVVDTEGASSFIEPGGPAVTVVDTLAPTRTAAVAGSSESINVRIFDERRQPKRLVAIIEVVSPGNKIGTENRELFLGKIEGFIQANVGTVVIDFVTTSSRSLHRELMLRTGEPDPEADRLSIASYRRMTDEMELWYRPLRIGQPLPQLCIPLFGSDVIPVPLEDVYRETWRRLRVDPDKLASQIAGADRDTT